METQTDKIKRVILICAEVTLGTSVILLTLFNLFFRLHRIDGTSMSPNLEDGELLVSRKTSNYKAGDIIVFTKDDTVYIKRIIATGSDIVNIKNNNVFVNGKLIKEDYLPKTVRTKIIPADGITYLFEEGSDYKIDENKFFVLGDNRSNSQDSRFAEVGLIDKNEIDGKIVMRLQPFEKFGVISSGTINYLSEGI